MLEIDDPVAYPTPGVGRTVEICVREVLDKYQLHFVAKMLRQEAIALMGIKTVLQARPRRCSRPLGGQGMRLELLEYNLPMPVDQMAEQLTAHRITEIGNTEKVFSPACIPPHYAWQKPPFSITDRYLLGGGAKTPAPEATPAERPDLELARTPAIKQL